MSCAVGPGDLVLCVNVAPNHVTREPAPLVVGETYRVLSVMELPRWTDALLDVGVDFTSRHTRFRFMPKPRFEAKTRRIPAPKEKQTVR